jgi:2-methylisocitrate lyase-like PEP mutase family enzyme
VPDLAGRLRRRLSEPGLVVVPGVTNALYARIAEQAGFEAIFATGAGIANTLLGVPDLGLTTMTEVVSVTGRIADAVSLPVIADADTGYGNHINVTRTMQEMERAGVAGLIIEDQVAPKRCGHFDGKHVVKLAEMVEKIVAAKMARRDPDLLIVARTDAIAVEGFSKALERANAYVAAGADIIFVEAPRSVDEISAIPREVSAPCLINVVEGGVTPLLSAKDLEDLGFKLAIYANLALRIAARAVEHAFTVLRTEGTSAALLPLMYSWEHRQEAVGTARWQELDRKVAEAAREILSSVRPRKR